MPRKYGKSAQKSVKRAMHKRKHGTLKSEKEEVGYLFRDTFRALFADSMLRLFSLSSPTAVD